MLVFIAFGLLMCYFCLQMVVRPVQFAERIIHFSHWRYFHPFEILTRLGFGLLFITYAQATRYPLFFDMFGLLMVLVALGLTFTPVKKHQAFALQVAQQLKPYFRYVGILTLPLGPFIIFAAISPKA
ncbi:hypothetical protein HII16_10890 [Thalassotalea sp. Y01]|nr:hypothetical protein [Thalassotalea sp. Y01]